MVAREQKAKSLELKLCMSIYDLHELRQNADKYRSQLGEIYGFFSEGFDTTDLVNAKSRLTMLDRPQVRQDTGPHFSHHAAWPRRRGDRMRRREFIAELGVAVAVPLTARAQSEAVARLAPKGELRAALIVSYPVLVTRRVDGQLGGVWVELARSLATKLGFPFA